MFLNIKKKPLIPLLFYSNRFISDFQHRIELFNDFFLDQCSLVNNNSKLPTNLNHVTDRRLSWVTFAAGDISKNIPNLNSKKAHGYDNISIRMLKISDDSINKPLELIFKQALIIGIRHFD